MNKLLPFLKTCKNNLTMNSNCTFRPKTGFSLVELMITVSLIGILAVVGIPMYQKFKHKAYSAEAKAALSQVYAGERSFFFEYNSYHSAF